MLVTKERFIETCLSACDTLFLEKNQITQDSKHFAFNTFARKAERLLSKLNDLSHLVATFAKDNDKNATRTS